MDKIKTSEMEFKINIESLRDIENNMKMDKFTFQKMVFFYNCVEQGWTIKKKNNSYVFTKQHEGQKQVFDDSFLMKFIKTNLDLNKIL
jgi:hypothetical protein